jgi:hypothetical protein
VTARALHRFPWVNTGTRRGDVNPGGSIGGSSGQDAMRCVEFRAWRIPGGPSVTYSGCRRLSRVFGPVRRLLQVAVTQARLLFASGVQDPIAGSLARYQYLEPAELGTLTLVE